MPRHRRGRTRPAEEPRGPERGSRHCLRRAAPAGDSITPRSLLCDISESRDLLDSIENTLIDEAAEKAEANEPIDPMERNEPTLPIESVDPTEPIERNESLDAMDHLPLCLLAIPTG